MNRLPRTLGLTCASVLWLTACQSHQEADLTSQLLYMASGTFDAKASKRERIGGGLRRVSWQSPPVAAQRASVQYDTDARSLAWKMQLEGVSASSTELTAGADKVQTPLGSAYLLKTPRLKDVLLLEAGRNWTLYTKGYVAQEEPALLPAFK